MIDPLRVMALTCLLLAAGMAASGAQGWALEDLLAMRKLIAEEHAAFVQERHSLLLDKPLISRGRLHYRAPDLLEQTITSPYPSHVRLDGDDLTLERDGAIRHASLRQYPEAARQASALRGILSGDRDALEDAFSLEWRGSRAAWSLRLTPYEVQGRGGRRDDAQAAPRIEIHGSGASVQRVEVRQSPGEWATMIIDPATAPSAPMPAATR